MLNNKECNQGEELTECLDHLNDGKQPIARDEELQELVEIAKLVKQSYHQEVDIPHLLISELVDNLAVELQERKRQKRRTHWLYGGLIGTAAAVLIAAFVQFLLPPIDDHMMAQQIDNRLKTEESVPIAHQENVPMIPQAEAMLEKQIQPSSSAQGPASPSVEKPAAEKLSLVIAEKLQVEESPLIEQKSAQVAMLQQEKPTDMTRNRSVLMAKMEMPTEITPEITGDHTSGALRQVYHQGTADEIIITRRLLAEPMIKTQDDPQQAARRKVGENPALQKMTKDTIDVINSLTVQVDQYSITIEGRKTKEELQKILESLTGIK